MEVTTVINKYINYRNALNDLKLALCTNNASFIDSMLSRVLELREKYHLKKII